MQDSNEVGLTKDAGWQMGVRKTVPKDFDAVWEFMFSDRGLGIWLGEVSASELEVGKEVHLKHGVRIKITVFKAFSHIRMQWKKRDWSNTSRLQLRILSSGKKTVISFAQEMLLSKAQRTEMIAHWKKVTEALSESLTVHP